MTNDVNGLQVNNFKFELQRLDKTTFYINNINLPGLSLGVVEQPNPFVTIPVQGDHLVYNDLTAEFNVDENLENYMEIYEWMRGLAYPDDFEQFKTLHEGVGLQSDATLVVTTNAENAKIAITFKGCYPISLGDIPFNIETNEPAITDVTFKYTSWDWNVLP